MEEGSDDWLRWWDAIGGGNRTQCDEFVGLSAGDALVLADIRDPRLIRIIDVKSAEKLSAAGMLNVITSDLVPRRLNLLVQDGMVVAAARF